MNLPSLTEISNKAQGAFQRFPITLLWAICGTLYTISVVDDSPSNVPYKANIILTFIVGVSWLIGAQFFSEQLKAKWKGYLLKIILLVLLILFYLHLPNEDVFNDNPRFVIRFFLYSIAGHLFVLFAPFLFKWDKAAYWNYLKSAGFAIVRSGIFSGVLYLGLVVALLAVDALFDIRIDSDLYFQLFIFCLGIVNTWIYLSDFPKNIHQQTEIHFNKALEVFVKHILIPLVILYIIILYAYGFKILIQWELPKGWVSYLVTALALLGFIIQVITNPIQKKVNSWTINQFYPWFYRFLLPLIVLLFVAITRRVSDYGITENRYFVFVIAFWILGMTLFLLFSKKKSLIILPLSLFVLAILSSFGFWGASSISQKSQIKQFTKVFDLVKANNNVATRSQHDQLRSILDYLDERKSVSKLNRTSGIEIKEMFKDTITDDEEGVYTWFDTYKVLDSLGITIDQKDINTAITHGKYHNYYRYREKPQNYNIKEYQHLALVEFHDYGNHKMEIGAYDINYDFENILLSLNSKNDSALVLEIPLNKKLIAFSKLHPNLHNIDPQEMTWTPKNDSISVTIIVEELAFYNKNDSISLTRLKAVVLLNQN